jgi:hypothetical protein
VVCSVCVSSRRIQTPSRLNDFPLWFPIGVDSDWIMSPLNKQMARKNMIMAPVISNLQEILLLERRENT